MDEIHTGVYVALLPTESLWCKQPFPHTTIISAGDTSELRASVFNTLAKSVASIAMVTNPISLKVLGIEVFGEEEKVDVLRLDISPELLAVRSFLENWDTGEFPVFKPHATIGPVGSAMFPSESMPLFLTFDRIVVCWGEQKIAFWLKKW